MSNDSPQNIVQNSTVNTRRYQIGSSESALSPSLKKHYAQFVPKSRPYHYHRRWPTGGVWLFSLHGAHASDFSIGWKNLLCFSQGSKKYPKCRIMFKLHAVGMDTVKIFLKISENYFLKNGIVEFWNEAVIDL